MQVTTRNNFQNVQKVSLITVKTTIFKSKSHSLYPHAPSPLAPSTFCCHCSGEAALSEVTMIVLQLILNVLYLWLPIPFELLPFLVSSMFSWITSSGNSLHCCTGFSSSSHFLNRSRTLNLVIDPLLFNIIHSIVFTAVL